MRPTEQLRVPLLAGCDDVLVSVLVWVQAWQMQCCGDPFAVGDDVDWTLDDQPDKEWLKAALGADAAARVTYSEESHGGLSDDAPTTRGRVLTIRTAHGRYTATPSGGRTLYPVPGSGLLTGANSVDGSESDISESRLNGYLVELDLDREQAV